MTPSTIFFIGKPGCGKGTQARLLGERTGWPVIGSGKQFRAISEEDSAVGRKVKEEIDSGLLGPDWFAMYLYLKSVFALSEGQSAIFDGFNRKLDEAKLNTASLEWLNRPYQVVEVEISDEEAVRRAHARFTEEGRADDEHPETRLAEYRAYTAPAIHYFREKGVLLTVNGEQSREAIAEDIAKALQLA